MEASKLQSFSRLLKIMDELREKCPWDQKQTWKSLRHLTIEETYELSEALLKEDAEEVKKELGDVFLHLVFYAKIASEKNLFDIGDVLEAICDKLVYRHPHIYSDVVVENEEDVKRNWEQLKLKEGNKSVLGGVPKGLPAMVKAQRIQEKARGVGFDWDHADQVWAKVQEELVEFKEEVDQNDLVKAEQELGDVFFALINYARFLGIHPETALERTNQKFISRFQHMEIATAQDQKSLSDMSLEEMDAYWENAKKLEKSNE